VLGFNTAWSLGLLQSTELKAGSQKVKKCLQFVPQIGALKRSNYALSKRSYRALEQENKKILAHFPLKVGLAAIPETVL
jgi:hypothetical protein